MKQRTFTKVIDGKVVSSLQFYAVELPSRHVGVIEEVATDEEYRKQGFATELIREAIEYAKSIGCTCVELTVREDKPNIQAFYKSFGFFDRLNRAFRLKL
jgi:ribosomal protein S18 acetylase RimI-like enzyme